MTTLLDLIPAPTTTGAAPMSTRLVDHLVRSGHLTENGLGRKVQVRTCPACGAACLLGLDDVVMAAEAQVDPSPLNPAGEVAALLSGRRTWALHREGARFVLDRREADHITSRPAGTARREDVLAGHRCHQRLDECLHAPSTFASIAASLPPNSPAPF